MMKENEKHVEKRSPPLAIMAVKPPSPPLPRPSSKMVVYNTFDHTLKERKQPTTCSLPASKYINHTRNSLEVKSSSINQKGALRATKPQMPLNFKSNGVENGDAKAQLGKMKLIPEKSTLSGKKGAKGSPTSPSLCAECTRAASEGAVCFIGNDGRVSACTTRTAVRLCKNLNCAANNPDYMADIASVPKKFLVSKRHQLKALYAQRPKNSDGHVRSPISDVSHSPDHSYSEEEVNSKSTQSGNQAVFQEMHSHSLEENGDSTHEFNTHSSLILNNGPANHHYDGLGCQLPPNADGSTDNPPLLNADNRGPIFSDVNLSEAAFPVCSVTNSSMVHKNEDDGAAVCSSPVCSYTSSSLGNEDDGGPVCSYIRLCVEAGNDDEDPIRFCTSPAGNGGVPQRSDSSASVIDGDSEVPICSSLVDATDGASVCSYTSLLVVDAGNEAPICSYTTSSVADVNEEALLCSYTDSSVVDEIPVCSYTNSHMVDRNGEAYLHSLTDSFMGDSSDEAPVSSCGEGIMELPLDDASATSHVPCSSPTLHVEFWPDEDDVQSCSNGIDRSDIMDLIDGLGNAVMPENESHTGAGMKSMEEFESTMEQSSAFDKDEDVHNKEVNGSVPWRQRRKGAHASAIIHEQHHAETVTLRKQLIQERRETEKWMLDHAIEEVVHKLAPSGETKVKVLVEAFETLISHIPIAIGGDHNNGSLTPPSLPPP